MRKKPSHKAVSLPIAHFFLRAAVVMMAACTAVSGAVWQFGKNAPSRAGTIYFSIEGASRTERHTYLFDPLFLVRYDLSNRQSNITDPTVSPDGEKMAYLYNDAGVSEIRLFDFGTGQVSTLYRKTEAEPRYVTVSLFSWSPSGRYVTFSSSGRLFKFDFATGEVSPLIHEDQAERVRDANPTWSPDETRIAFASSSRDTSNWQVYLVNADGSDLHRVTHETVCVFYAPYWSPRSNMLILDGGCDESSGIFLLDADTEILKPLTSFQARMWAPAWSPDGSQVLFISGRSAQDQRVYIVNADGSGLRRLTGGNIAFWSPDSQTILSGTLTGDLYTIRSDGTNLQRVTFTGGTPFVFPSGWSR